MSMRAPHEGDVEHSRQGHVVGEDAAAGEEPRGLRPDHALADIAPALLDAGGHAPLFIRALEVLRIASTIA